MSEAGKAVFLSYASQDAEAAKRICEALRQAGVEVWFDAEGGLEHGDEWDAKIRRQIKECVLFIAVISAHTQAREEGYFRIEWELAAQRALGIASGVAFILPVVIDNTREPDALVPDRFRAVQWTKLPGGTVPPEVLARFLKLWSHRTGALKYAADSRAQRLEDRDQVIHASAPPKLGRKFYAGLTVVVLAIVAAYLILKPRRSPEEIARIAADGQKLAAVVAPPAAPPSEAQQLIAKVWVLLNKPEMARAELDAADALCSRAAMLNPTDADVWAAWAQVCNWYVFHNLDASTERRAAARDYATRAMQLNPRSFDARLAQASYWVMVDQGVGSFAKVNGAPGSVGAGTEVMLRDLLQDRPSEPRALFALAVLKFHQDYRSEDKGLLEELEKNPAFASIASKEIAWQYFWAGRWAKAEVAADRSIALQPDWDNLGLKLYLALWWHGDLQLAKVTLDRMPPTILQEDWGAYLFFEVYRWRREPQTALSFLNNLPREWLRSNQWQGPKAFLIGRTRLMAKQDEAARGDFRRALEQVERHLADDPNNETLLTLKALTLDYLGENAAAEKTYRLIRELTASPELGLAILFENPDKIMDRLEAEYESNMWLTAAALRSDPTYDPVRGNPRFAALCARAEADPTKSPGARAMANSRTTDQGSQTTPSSLSPSLSPPPDVAAVASAKVDAKSVAVLAFANLSDDKNNEYFSDGISEELLNVLAKVPGLKVSARTSAFYFKGKEVPVPEIAQKLGVAYVVEGSVRKAGDKVRITAQLIKAADGFHVWSDTFTRDLKDIFAVQDEIAGLIAKNLELKMGLGASQAHRSVDPEALRLMLEGRYFLTPRTSAGFDRAERAFTAALKIDPQFAQAQAGLASTTALRGRYRLLDGAGLVSEFDQLAIAQSRLALQMDPALAEPHATLGFVYTDTGQLAEAEQEMGLAIAANPNFATAYHWHSHVLAAQGRLDLALLEIGKAEALDPVSFIILFIRGFYLSDARRYPEALETLDRAVAIRGESFLPLESDRARVLLALGRQAEALAVARRILQDPRLISSGWYAAGEALYVLHSGGAADEATRLAPGILQAMPAGSYQRGYVLCAIGRFTEGMQALAHIPDIVRSRLYWHPMLDPVRDTPEFRQMLEKFNTVAEYKVARETFAHMLQEQEVKK